MHVFFRARLHVHIRMHSLISASVSMHVRMHVCLRARLHVHIRMHSLIFASVSMHVRMHCRGVPQHSRACMYMRLRVHAV